MRMGPEWRARGPARGRGRGPAFFRDSSHPKQEGEPLSLSGARFGRDLDAPGRQRCPAPMRPRWLRLTLPPLMFAVASIAQDSSWDATARRQAVVFAAQTLSDIMSVNTVVIILRSECPASRRIKARFEELGIAYYALDLERRDDGAALQAALADLAGAVPSCAERRGQVVCPSKGLPRVFVRGQHVGGAVETSRAFESGELAHLAADNGGGEGGGDDGGDEGGEQCAEPSAGPKPADGRAEASPRRTSVAGERLSVRGVPAVASRGTRYEDG